MEKPQPVTDETLDAYIDGLFAGSLSPAERVLWDAWVAQSDDRRTLIANVYAAWTATAGPDRSSAAAVQMARETVLQRVRESPAHPWRSYSSAGHSPWSRRARWGMGSALAAAAIGVAILGQRVSRSLSDHARVSSTVYAQSYTTSTGQTAQLTLDDGTRVTLAPQSRLRIAPFMAKQRMVALDGEAYFNVSSHTGTPFVVQTGRIRATVLGTAFTVRNYPADARVRVTVVTGRVSVVAQAPHGAPAITLAAGDLGYVTDSTSSTLSSVDVSRYTDWMNGHLVFQEAPTDEVLASLTRWYGFRFRLADSALVRRNLTVALSTRSSSAALATLKLLLNVDMKFDETGTDITLIPRARERLGPVSRRQSLPAAVPPTRNEVGR